MAEIIGVTFKEGGKVYYFAPGEGEYAKGSGVVVETARGVEYATVTIPRCEVDDSKIVAPLKPVVRVATKRDTETYRKNIERKDDAMRLVRERIAAYNLDMKLIDCEFAFEGNKAVFYYTAPKRVDFRELVKDLSSAFCMRIELRQVGLRDGIQMLGGLAPCGRECCCATCMPDIKKVSIKMAKNQGLSLNPSKISGLCGRLMCCLSYENDYYAEACKSMPKLGSEITTPEGKGTVVNLNMLKMQVRVKIEDKTKDVVAYKDYAIDELNYQGGATEKKNGQDDADETDETEDVFAEESETPVSPQTDTKPEEHRKGKNNRKKGGKPKGEHPQKDAHEKNANSANAPKNRQTKPENEQKDRKNKPAGGKSLQPQPVAIGDNKANNKKPDNRNRHKFHKKG